MKSRQRSAWALAVAALLIALLWNQAREPGEGGRAGEAATPLGGEVASSDTQGAKAAGTAEASAPRRQLVPAETSGRMPEPESLTREGRVLDVQGRPAMDVPLRWHRPGRTRTDLGDALGDEPVRSDAQGRFALEIPEGDEVLVVLAGEGYVTLRTTACRRAGAPRALLVVVAPACSLRGFVHNEQGGAVAGCQVVLGTFLLPEFPEPLEDTVQPGAMLGIRARTGGDGRFELRRMPIAPGLSLLFTREGYVSRRVATSDAQGGFLDVLLRERSDEEQKIVGTVFDEAGQRLPGARLCYGRSQFATSGPEGEFDFRAIARALPIVAAYPGRRCVRIEGVGRDSPMPLELRFRGPCLEILGRVVDADGKPLPGMLVNLVDPVRIGPGMSAERFADPQPEEGFAGRRAGSQRRERRVRDSRTRRARLPDAGLESGHGTVCAVSDVVQAGSRDVVLTLGGDRLLDELRGRVLTRDGQPVRGAVVSTYLVADRVDQLLLVHGPRATSDAQGRFVLEEAPTQHVFVAVHGEEFVYRRWPVEELLQRGELRLEVLRKCFVQVEGPVGLRLRFLDGAGKELMVEASSRDRSLAGNGWTLRHEKSPVIAMPETAATLVWSKGARSWGAGASSSAPVGTRSTA